MRILVLAYDYLPNLGGIARATHSLAQALSRIPGTEVTLLAREITGPKESPSEKTAKDSFAIHRVPLSKHRAFAIFQFAVSLLKISKTLKPHVIVNTLWLPDGVATWLLKNLGLCRTPYVTLAYGNELLETDRTLKKRIRSSLSWIKRSVLSQSSQVFPISRYTADLVAQCGVPRDRIEVIYCGVDSDQFHPLKQTSPSTGAQPTFLSIARLEDFKGIDTALKAFQIIREKAKLDFQYLIGGIGPDQGRLEGLVREYQLENHVQFLGKIPERELNLLYNQCDVFVLLTREDLQGPNVEGLGLVLLEAGVCAKPCIAGNSGGIPEVVQDQATGWIVSPVEPSEVAAAIEQAITRKDLRVQYGQAARARILKMFSWDRSATSFLESLKKNLAPINKTICLYTIANHLGGAERCLLDLAIGLRNSQTQEEAGFQPWVLVPKANGPLNDALLKNQIPFEVLPLPKSFLKISRSTPLRSLIYLIAAIPGMIIYLMRVVNLLRSTRTTLLHSNSLKCHYLSALVKPFVSQLRVIWHIHDIIGSGWNQTGLTMAAKIAEPALIANSMATAHALERPLCASVVHNGIDPAVFFPNPNRSYRDRFANAEQVPIIGIVGILARWKGQIEFLQMAHALISKGMDARFVIIGDQIYDTLSDQNYALLLRKKVTELGLSNHVYFSGFEPDPARAINGLDLLVHASIKPEPFGRVILEAMACNIPVVAANAGGVPEILEHDQDGLLYPPGDVQAMQVQVTRLLTSQTLRHRLTDAAMKKLLQRFTLKAHIRSLVDEYNKNLLN